MLPLLAARTYEEGLPPETRISGFWDSAIQSAVGKERIQYIPPQPLISQRSQFQSQRAAQEPPITQAGQRGQTMGRGRGRGPHAGTLGV